jgi:hypothetical protein
MGNPACPYHLLNTNCTEYDYQKYRLYVIKCLPKLRVLDAKRVTAVERDFIRHEMEQDMKGLKLNFSYFYEHFGLKSKKKNEHEHHSPLPDSIRKIGDHRGAYGTYRYRYVGKESEGNRFILNNDL